MKLIATILLIWNVGVFFLYGLDKLFAKNGSRRISEGMLLFCAFLAGCPGAMMGMVVWNHKTSKIKFRILVPLFLIAWIIACFFLQKGMLFSQ